MNLGDRFAYMFSFVSGNLRIFLQNRIPMYLHVLKIYQTSQTFRPGRKGETLMKKSFVLIPRLSSRKALY